MTFEVIDKTTGEVADADELGASIALDEENCVSWFAVENSDDGGMVYIVNSEGHCKRLPPDRFEVRFPEVEALQSALTAEQQNRCCGNCLYMDTIFEITGERQCEITKRSADKESDPCEHWRSCRG